MSVWAEWPAQIRFTWRPQLRCASRWDEGGQERGRTVGDTSFEWTFNNSLIMLIEHVLHNFFTRIKFHCDLRGRNFSPCWKVERSAAQSTYKVDLRLPSQCGFLSGINCRWISVMKLGEGRVERLWSEAQGPSKRSCSGGWLLYHISEKYYSLSYVSNLSNLKTGRGTAKKHSFRSIDRANIYRDHFVFFCCMSFNPKLWGFEKMGGRDDTGHFNLMLRTRRYAINFQYVSKVELGGL